MAINNRKSGSRSPGKTGVSTELAVNSAASPPGLMALPTGGEGKAGMAALVVDKNFDIEALTKHLEGNLPFYARPVFLRFTPEIETTSTFKQRKIELQKQGFDPAVIPDPMSVREAATGHYAPLTAALYDDICKGRVKL